VTSCDEAWWIQRYQALERPLYNVVYRWVWDSTESQDIVQEAFLRCWRARDRIRADTFKALVFRVAINLASNHRRRKRLWRLVSFESLPEELVDVGAAPGVESRALRDAVDSLPEQLKRVLLLCEVADMSYRDIAAIMGIREGTVGSRRTRALAIVRRKLEAAGGKSQ
jgi:RNA polymerase sigma-70 factor (ECF subfamily)